MGRGEKENISLGPTQLAAKNLPGSWIKLKTLCNSSNLTLRPASRKMNRENSHIKGNFTNLRNQ
jgi:hypothetical protein